MRRGWTLLTGLLLLAPAQPVMGAEGTPAAATTLQQITREAEERLQEWDDMNLQEQERDAKYWWLAILEWAAALAIGHQSLAELQFNGLKAKAVR